MPGRNLLRAFMLLWWTAALLLLVGSLQTLSGALKSTHQAPLVLLAAVEAVSAVLFLLPRTLRAGAGGLLLCLAVAFVAHLHQHQFRWDLLFYAATVYFVAVHGPLPRPQWEKAASFS
jgi:hypothetical protein